MTPARSIFGTNYIPRITICWSCVKDWGSVYAFTRKVLAISAFTLISIALYPAFAPAQLPLSNERLTEKAEEMNRRLLLIEQVPLDVSAMKVDIINIKYQIKEMSERMTYVMLGICGAFGIKLLEVFGVSIKKKEE